MANLIHLNATIKSEATLQSDPMATVKIIDGDEAPMHVVVVVHFFTSIGYRF